MQALPSATWRKSSHSGGGNNCVELAALPAGVGVRDSKDPSAAVVLLPEGWRRLLAEVKAGRLDL